MKDFYLSREWRELRYRVLNHYGRKCMCCNASDTKLHVDHIKPISLYPELKLDPSNLQVLCEDCNIGKSNKDETDFRSRGKKILHIKIPPLEFGYITITNKFCHIWNGTDTYCRMWSTGGLRKERFKEFSRYPNNKICSICQTKKDKKHKKL